MDAPVVMKDVGRGPEQVLREPRPEILCGRDDSLRRMLAILPFARKYTSMVLSFASEDVDCSAFNAGEPDLRGHVDLALRLVLELGFAGIPAEARPVHYVTSHTHAGRLEVNLALPRAVFRPEGRIMSHNPHPPERIGLTSNLLWFGHAGSRQSPSSRTQSSAARPSCSASLIAVATISSGRPSK